MNRSPQLALVVCLLLSFAGGCGPSKVTFDPTGKEKLEEIGQMLKTVKIDGTKPPAKVADLGPVEPMVPLAAQDLRSGDIVYFWGAGLSTGGNAASTIVAHEKKVPAEGGWVLTQDGTVKRMSADEFRSAPKAGK
jgi:hypothetical protein